MSVEDQVVIHDSMEDWKSHVLAGVASIVVGKVIFLTPIQNAKTRAQCWEEGDKDVNGERTTKSLTGTMGWELSVQLLSLATRIGANTLSDRFLNIHYSFVSAIASAWVVHPLRFLRYSKLFVQNASFNFYTTLSGLQTSLVFHGLVDVFNGFLADNPVFHLEGPNSVDAQVWVRIMEASRYGLVRFLLSPVELIYKRQIKYSSTHRHVDTKVRPDDYPSGTSMLLEGVHKGVPGIRNLYRGSLWSFAEAFSEIVVKHVVYRAVMSMF